MIFLSFILVYLLNTRSEREFLNVQKTFFLENDFWCADQEKLKTNKGYLYKVDIDVEHTNFHTLKYVYDSKTCFSLKSTNCGYVAMEFPVVKSINSFLNSPKDNNFLLKINCFFTDKPIKSLSNFDKYEGKLKKSVTYKMIEKTSNNSIRFRSDGIDIRMKHIKDMSSIFLLYNPPKYGRHRLFRLFKYVKFTEPFNREKVLKRYYCDHIDFCYFENYYECRENSSKIYEDLLYLKLIEDEPIEDDSFDCSGTVFFKMSYGKTIPLKVSEFKKRLRIIFLINFKKLYDTEINEIWKELFDNCFYCLVKEMLNKNFFLICGKYDINYYVNELSNIIFKLIIDKKEQYTVATFEDKYYVACEMVNELRINLINFQEKAVKELCETEFFTKHFSKLLGREARTLNDYIEIEKMVCDYHNWFAFIYESYALALYSSDIIYDCASPISIGQYNLQIIDGIKIDSSNEIKHITGFNNKGGRIIMEKDTDFYFDQFGVLFCPSNVLKMKDIHELEVFFNNDKKNNNERFKIKINKYLNM